MAVTPGEGAPEPGVAAGSPYAGRVTEEKCWLHASHAPRSLAQVTWLVFPAHLQEQVWGEVRENATVPLCPNGELAVALAIEDLVACGRWLRVYSGKERRLAALGYARWRIASKGREARG